jgi:hypothetical protein
MTKKKDKKMTGTRDRTKTKNNNKNDRKMTGTNDRTKKKRQKQMTKK